MDFLRSLMPSPSAWKKNVFCLDKNFCSEQKSSYLLGKRMEKDFLAMELFWLRTKNFVSTKIILSRQIDQSLQ